MAFALFPARGWSGLILREANRVRHSPGIGFDGTPARAPRGTQGRSWDESRESSGPAVNEGSALRLASMPLAAAFRGAFWIGSQHAGSSLGKRRGPKGWSYAPTSPT